ncbi:flagellar biosynthetic protein FliO [Microvirga massiliensis]|uniref:flagellar biosynthetic protein FliO n=1 Tax=Microvirga massiliensis TaxID=1033741 RepID=UPI00062BE9F9|nr:flagellar biosynthetic protein FliO [Microvirga massiliensis]
MLSRFGIEASQAAWYVIAFAIILVLLALMGWLMRKYGGGRLMLPGQDRGRARQPRLGVVDIYDLDRQRQLILLRRDNVEHLLLIGGPNDLVVETNIIRAAGARLPSAPGEASVERLEPSFERPPEAPSRPQVEQAVRPALENQPAGHLGAALDQVPTPEKAPVPVVNAPEPTVPPRREPVLKPDQIVAGPASVTPLRPAANRRNEAPPPSVEPGLRPAVPPAPAPEPVAAPPQRPPVQPVLRATNLPQDRMGGTPGRAPREGGPSGPRPPSPAVDEPSPTPPARPVRGPDAAILSDMARQLEEALRRPTRPAGGEAQPRPPEPDRGPVRDDLREPAPSAPAGRADAAPPAGRVSPPPVRTPPAPDQSAGPAPSPGVPAPGPVSAAPPPPDRAGPRPTRQEAGPAQGPVLSPRPQPPAAAPAPSGPHRPAPAGSPGFVMPARPAEPAKPAPEAQAPVVPAEGKAAPASERARVEEPEAPSTVGSKDTGETHGPSKPESGPAATPPEKPAPDPVAAAMASKPSAPPPPAPASAPSPRSASDPFSVEEIEAEFARLLGRTDGNKP